MSKRIYLSPPHMNGSEIGYIQQAFDENWIAPAGPNLTGFEAEMCEYNGIRCSVALSSGTAAMHLALRYIGITRGDVVFCSDLTLSGSCNPVIYEGAKLVFIDSQESSWNMSPVALEKALKAAKKRGTLPKAVIIVDLYGQSANYDKILPLCREYGVPVIEDAAEALGAEFNGRKCGTFGEISIFSFNGNKIITTSGGGMAVSDDAQAIEKIHFWANQAKEPANYYLHKELGFNYRMSNICAGIGRGQLRTLDERIARRKEINAFYIESFKSLPVTAAPVFEGSKPNYWLTVFTIDEGCEKTPDEIISALAADNIEARRAWNPMHSQPYYSDCEYFKENEDFSVSEHIFQRGICMPSGSQMTAEDLERVAKVFSSAFGK
ncbi:MAG: DegT/DnrJ/EryC1/StrS family aminotransferase [Clostridiales bacterium]|nr:DegT/DnrJ/EryC1/StrS family aminotransferase [Clostridiales bacterium]